MKKYRQELTEAVAAAMQTARGEVRVDWLPAAQESVGAYVARMRKDEPWAVGTLLDVWCGHVSALECPFYTWEEDVPYYRAIGAAFRPLGEEELWRERIAALDALLEDKIAQSLNRNKTPEELFAGWDD